MAGSHPDCLVEELGLKEALRSIRGRSNISLELETHLPDEAMTYIEVEMLTYR